MQCIVTDGTRWHMWFEMIKEFYALLENLLLTFHITFLPIVFCFNTDQSIVRTWTHTRYAYWPYVFGVWYVSNIPYLSEYIGPISVPVAQPYLNVTFVFCLCCNIKSIELIWQDKIICISCWYFFATRIPTVPKILDSTISHGQLFLGELWPLEMILIIVYWCWKICCDG